MEERRSGEPGKWSESGLVEHFKRIHAQMRNRRFCFVLGAGASLSSGIKGAAPLAKKWLGELHRLEGGGHSFEEWATADSLGIEGFDPSDPAASYPEIFERRFGHDREEGFADLETEMERARPALGYSLLSEILAGTRHRVVVTTNFDNLVADALSQHGKSWPLICSHESLAGFARSELRRPLVAKVHRDLFLDPINDTEGTNCLAGPWAEALGRLFAAFTPIFVGYGGNDGSLMGFLEALERKDVLGRLVWCYWYRDPPSDRVRALVGKLGGVLVPILGFDELMLRLFDALDWKVRDQESALRGRADELVAHYGSELQRVQGVIKEAEEREGARRSEDEEGVGEGLGDGEVSAASRALEAVVKGADSWWTVQLAVNAEEDPEVKARLFEAGVEHFPDEPGLLGNYANFLKAVRGEHDRAEHMYERAIAADPEHANNLGNFAVFLKNVREEHDRAEELYERAIAADPEHANNLANYATFLKDVRGKHDQAQQTYERAIAADPKHTIGLGSYAVLHMDVRGDHDRAEELLERALAVKPHHPDNLGNYAELLLRTGRFDEAALRAAAAWAATTDKGSQAAVAVLRGLARRASACLDAPALGRLRSLLNSPGLRSTWRFSQVLEALGQHLSEEDFALYSALARVVRAEADVSILDEHGRWLQVEEVDPQLPWPAESLTG